eukprot:3159548-Heterocapsa_arctica.AAC.1
MKTLSSKRTLRLNGARPGSGVATPDTVGITALQGTAKLWTRSASPIMAAQSYLAMVSKSYLFIRSAMLSSGRDNL